MTPLVGLLIAAILLLVICTIRLRADLLSANWMLARLVFRVLSRRAGDVELLDVVDHATLVNFVEGHMTLAEFYQAVLKNL